MLFRRQNDPATPVTTTAASKPFTATGASQVTGRSDADGSRTPALTATALTATAAAPTLPTAPIAQAQQRRVVTTPSGSFSMPANNTGAREGSRKLQVGRDITLSGEIGACDHLAIEGTVQATIKQLQQFDILDHGQFSGSVTTENADINGSFDGDLTVTGRLWLRQNATVTGTIRYAALQVEKGACLRGTIDMLDSQTPAQPGTTFPTESVASDTADYTRG